jgi:nitroreductase/NAD-dependent dihydropyrimidine dehydrogenase PreA subunit
MFTIDLDRCARDGICAEECPVGLITMKGGVPEPVKGADKLCMSCGHCVAVCPRGAFSLSTMAAADCPEIDRNSLPAAGQLDQLIRSRRSVRVYRDEPVAREKLAGIIDTARYAPSAKNRQLIDWLVISDKEKRQELVVGAIDWMRDLLARNDPAAVNLGAKRVVAAWEKGADPILRSAPCLIATHAPAVYGGGVVDGAIALATFELMAATQGLGTCWAGYFFLAASNWPPVREALELPAGHAVTGAMMVGYARYRYQRIPARKEAGIVWR